MVTSIANVAAGVAGLLLSALVLCFNVPRVVAPQGWPGAGGAEPTHSRLAGFAGVRATATIEDVGHGRERVTVWVDFNGQRNDDEGL